MLGIKILIKKGLRKIKDTKEFRDNLREIIELALDGIGYTDEYFLEKWHMREDFDRLSKYFSHYLDEEL